MWGPFVVDYETEGTEEEMLFAKWAKRPNVLADVIDRHARESHGLSADILLLRQIARFIRFFAVARRFEP